MDIEVLMPWAFCRVGIVSIVSNPAQFLSEKPRPPPMAFILLQRVPVISEAPLSC